MMENKFKYSFDKKTALLSVIETLSILAVAVLIFIFTSSGYMRAWLFTVFVAAILLYILSIPRYIKVTKEALEIHCVVEMTSIQLKDIATIKKITSDDYGRMLLTLGSFGFFGYFGYFYSTRYWESVKIYATEWNNFVQIEDIYEQKYIVSCRDADELIGATLSAISDSYKNVSNAQNN